MSFDTDLASGPVNKTEFGTAFSSGFVRTTGFGGALSPGFVVGTVIHVGLVKLKSSVLLSHMEIQIWVKKLAQKIEKLGRSEGGLAVITLQQSPQTNIGISGNLSMKNNNSNNNKVVNEEETNDTFPVGMRVLVVDDDPICLLLLENLLCSCQYQVTTCGQAMTALNLLRENKDKFDLVISDDYMPDMDGFKLLELVGLEMDLPVINGFAVSPLLWIGLFTALKGQSHESYSLL
eukprot:Gb_15883 [translate_table: standard]